MKEPLKPDFRVPVVAIVIIELAALFARSFLQVRLTDGGMTTSLAKDLSYLVVPPIMIVLLFPILRQHWPFLRSLMRRQDLSIRVILMAVLLGLLLRATYWGGLISLGSFGILRSSNPNAIAGPEFSFACPEPGILLLSLLVTACLTPIVEEVTNRGLILPALMNKGRLIAVIVSSVLFAVMHNPQAIVLAFVIGLFLGFQILKGRTLWGPIITHATYNAMVVLDWDCLHGKWNPVETTPALIGVGTIALAVAITCFLFSIVIVWDKDIGVHQHPDSQSS